MKKKLGLSVMLVSLMKSLPVKTLYISFMAAFYIKTNS